MDSSVPGRVSHAEGSLGLAGSMGELGKSMVPVSEPLYLPIHTGHLLEMIKIIYPRKHRKSGQNNYHRRKKTARATRQLLASVPSDPNVSQANSFTPLRSR